MPNGPATATAIDLLESLPIAGYVCDRSGAILRWNRRAVGLWGREPSSTDRFRCGRWSAGPGAGPLPASGDPVAAAIVTRQPQPERDLLLERADGSSAWVAVSVEPTGDGGAMVVLHDIAARRSAEQTLRDDEQCYRELAENLPQLVWTTDGAGKFVYANRNWTEYTGMDLATSRDTDWRDLVHPEDHERVMSTWGTAFAAGEPYQVEFRMRRAADGAFRWYLVRAWPQRGSDGLIRRWQGTSTDIHDLKRAQLAAARAEERRARIEQDLRRQAEDLQRSNTELEQFAYVAAHDLQEPTRMIASYLQLIERRIGPTLDDKTRGYFAFVTAGAMRMRDMVRSILEYSRIGKEGVRPTTISADAALRLALENLAEKIAKQDAAVEHGELPRIHAVAPQITRLFQNLVSNAIKFRGAEPPRVRIAAERTGAEWTFAVEDNGIGIKPHEGKRLFGLFQRLHATDKYPGTGIGLASCKKIVEQHQGRIWFEPAGGGGTVFKFTLPAAEETPVSTSGASAG